MTHLMHPVMDFSPELGRADRQRRAVNRSDLRTMLLGFPGSPDPVKLARPSGPAPGMHARASNEKTLIRNAEKGPGQA